MRFKFFAAFSLFSFSIYAGGETVDVTEPTESFWTPSTATTITEPSQTIDDSFLILPGFAEGFRQYRRLALGLVGDSHRVAILVARSRDGIGIHLKDFDQSVKTLREKSDKPWIAIVHSISTVWIIQYLQEFPEARKNIRGVIITNPVLQSPILIKESWAANSETRDTPLQVHVRLGTEQNPRDILVDEYAGHIRDLIRGFNRALRPKAWPQNIPVAILHDVRDPVLRGKENRALKLFYKLESAGLPVRILSGELSDRADVHNLLHDPRFVKTYFLGGRYQKLLSQTRRIRRPDPGAPAQRCVNGLSLIRREGLYADPSLRFQKKKRDS